MKQSEEIDKAKLKLDNPIMNEQSFKTLFVQEMRQTNLQLTPENSASNNNSENKSPMSSVVYNRYGPLIGSNSAYQNSAY